MVPMIPPIRGYQPVSTSSLLSCREGAGPFVTLVSCGKYRLHHPDYFFIFIGL